MSRPSGVRPPRLQFGWPQVIAALFIAAIVCASASPTYAQRRPPRGDRGGYGGGGYGGAGGYGGVGSSRDSNTESDAAPKGPATYPERAVDPSAGPLGEYQKPTYDHYRFVVSPDGTKLALSGRHLTKEAPGVKVPPARSKPATSGKPSVIANVLEVIDVASGRSLMAFKPPALFENLAFSPDNRFLAAESTDRPGVVNVLHLPTKKPKEFKTNLRRIMPGGIIFSSDGRSIHVIGPDRLLTIALANGETKELKYELTTPAASFSPATNMLAAGVSRSRLGKPEVQVYDVAEGKEIEQLAVPTAPTRLQFSADGKWLVAALAGGTLRAWQTSDWSEVESSAGRIGIEAGQLAVSPDGNEVAVLPRIPAREDSKVIDIKTGDVVQSVRTHDLYFLPSGVLAVASAKGPFYLDINTGDLAELPPGAGDAALVQSGDAPSPFGDTAGQTSARQPAGYGTYGQPPGGQPGYGGAPPKPSDQPGYGGVSPQTASDQPPASSGQSPPPDPNYGRL